MTLRCKTWSCDICRPFNHRRIKRLAREGKPNMFLTLTVNPARYATPDQAAQDMSKQWPNLRRCMERDLGIKKPPFIVIFEQTKAGWPHMHILMRSKFISQQWISSTWKRLTGAHIVDVRFIQDTGRVAAYVAKYVSKAPEAFAHTKRWWRSHDYAVEKQEVEPFKRFGSFVEEVSGGISNWLWKAYGGRARLTEARDGYWRWLVDEVPSKTDQRPRSMSELYFA